jgi:tRNA(Ile2) C34 agmatinyltransferase TiaS
MLYIGIDDTDNLESRGTGRLARAIAEELSREYTLLGVTRHQLLVDPRVPYTSHNSSAAICLQNGDGRDLPPRCFLPQRCSLPQLFERVQALMMADFIPGSDPGLCLADVDTAQAFSGFGRRAKIEIVTQAEARTLAEAQGALLAGLGGSQDGVIGALAAVGLAASGEDGRYLLVGRSRELNGLQDIPTVLASGISAVVTADDAPVSQGRVLTDKLRPARRSGKPVLYVEWQGDHWLPLKYD